MMELGGGLVQRRLKQDISFVNEDVSSYSLFHT